MGSFQKRNPRREIIMIPVTNKSDSSFKEYKHTFSYVSGKAVLKISSDFRFAAYLNGKLASNSQYADIPEKKVYNTVEVTSLLHAGDNELFIVAMSTDADYSVARKMPPFVAYEIVADGSVIARSGRETLTRSSARYTLGSQITPQIGKGYNYDFTAKENEWQPACKVNEKFHFVPRPVKNLNVAEQSVKSEIVAQGVFVYNGGETSAEKMQNAYLRTVRFGELAGKPRMFESRLPGEVKLTSVDKNADGVFAVVDLKRETAGYLDLCVVAENDCTALLGWGEHLSDLRVRTSVGGRNFAFEIKLKKGENQLKDYILRLGCRYLCLYVNADSCVIKRLSLFEATYPFGKPDKDFGDRLLNKIYETGRRTLELCVHEHYEDCPWRDQALYGMDSRNQLLFGYGAFNETAFPRASLRLFADTLTDGGLIPLCAPAEIPFTIPSFSAYWLIAICENAEKDYDEKFVKEILPFAEKTVEAFKNHCGKRGMTAFSERGYWNFHEWVEGLDGGDFNRKEREEEKFDGILTAVTYVAMNKLAKLYERVGETEKAAESHEFAMFLKNSVEGFYDKQKGLYVSYILSDGSFSGYHGYMQSVVAAEIDIPAERLSRLAEVLKNPDGKIIPQTFASLQFKYEAIIKADGNLNFVLEDICGNFGKMLFEGATSYYETENGEADFFDAGSLCHGWAAVPCYIFDKYLENKAK